MLLLTGPDILLLNWKLVNIDSGIRKMDKKKLKHLYLRQFSWLAIG